MNLLNILELLIGADARAKCFKGAMSKLGTMFDVDELLEWIKRIRLDKALRLVRVVKMIKMI